MDSFIKKLHTNRSNSPTCLSLPNFIMIFPKVLFKLWTRCHGHHPFPPFYLFPKPTNKYKERKIVGHSTFSVSNCTNVSQSKRPRQGIKVVACHFGPNSLQECLTPYPFSVQPHNIQNKIQRAIRCQGAHMIIAMFIGEHPIG